MKEKKKNIYDLQYGDMYEADKWVRLRFNIYKSLLLPFLKNGVRLLDIGCYMGDLLVILPSFVDYYGIDNDKSALLIAKKRGAKVTKLDLENEQIPLTEEFDIIIATELLEHLKNPEELVLQMKCLLKKDGVVLISLPNECTLYHRLKVLLGKGIDGTGFAPYYHLHFPTMKQNDEFIEKHFEIVEKCYWVHIGVGGKLESILSLFPYRIWLRLANLCPSWFTRGVIYRCQK